MGLKILGDRILIRPNQLIKEVKVTRDDGSSVGIVISHGESEKRHEAATTEGEVAQLGPLAYADETPWCTVGDRVHWGKYGGYWITDPESKEDFVVLDPHDILCVITTGEAK